MKTQSRNILSRIYILSIILSIIPLILFSYSSININILPQMLFWIALVILSEYKPIVISKSDEMSLSFIVHLSTIIILGTKEAIIIAMIGTLIVELLSRKSIVKILFNIGQMAIATFISGLVFYMLKLSPDNIRIDVIKDFPAILSGVSVYFVLNSVLVSLVICLVTGDYFRNIFYNDFKIFFYHYFLLSPTCIIVAMLYEPHKIYVILVLLPPLIVADSAMRRYFDLHRQTIETLEVLADIIDARDKYTYAHSSRVADYSKKIAQEMGLMTEEINEIETAGKIHDLGKIEIDDSILRKGTKLTDEEFAIIKRHPEIGYKILSKLRPYRKGSLYVLHHHERYDGKGYPSHLAGSDIPLGARIITVADSFDAMTSDRPYRKAMSQSEAVEELKRCSLTQFDPEVVKAFIEVLEKNQ